MFIKLFELLLSKRQIRLTGLGGLFGSRTRASEKSCAATTAAGETIGVATTPGGNVALAGGGGGGVIGAGAGGGADAGWETVVGEGRGDVRVGAGAVVVLVPPRIVMSTDRKLARIPSICASRTYVLGSTLPLCARETPMPPNRNAITSNAATNCLDVFISSIVPRSWGGKSGVGITKSSKKLSILQQ